MVAPVSPTSPTTRLGKYELLRRLAIGGMGEIFLARERGVAGFDRLVVVKRLIPELAERPELVALFIDEARIAAHLAHGNIVQIYEFGVDAGAYFLSMEYVPGHNLARLCERAAKAGEPLPRAIAVHVLAEMAEALGFAHAAADAQGKPLGVVHRDVSPQNLLVSVRGDVKLMDFGIAKAANKLSRTETGVIRGKFSYMSPEQIEGRELDARSDVFSTGIMLWELTLWKRLFSGKHDVEIIDAVRGKRIPAPREIDPDYPEALEAIVMGALERDPARRTASATTLAASLRAFLAASNERVDKDAVAALVRHLVPESTVSEPADPGEPDAIEPSDVETAPVRVTSAAPTPPRVEIVHVAAQAATKSDRAPARPPVSHGRRRAPIVIGLVALAMAAIAAGVGLTSRASLSVSAPTMIAATTPTPSPTPTPTRVEPTPVVAPDAGAPDTSAQLAGAEAAAEAAATARHRRAIAEAPPAHPPVVATTVDKVDPPVAPTTTPTPVRPGTIIVSSDPWGDVTVDGKGYGRTDVSLAMVPGQHAVDVAISQGGKRVHAVAAVESDKKTKCRASASGLSCGAPR